MNYSEKDNEEAHIHLAKDHLKVVLEKEQLIVKLRELQDIVKEILSSGINVSEDNNLTPGMWIIIDEEDIIKLNSLLY